MLQLPSHKRRDWIDSLIFVVLLLTLVSGLLLRTYRMDWDSGHAYSFHPDERAVVYSAVSNISLPWPPDIKLLLTPESPLNPHFFAYGSLPMYLMRGTSHVLSFVVKGAWTNEKLWISGRGLSAVFDITTVYIAFLLGRKLYGRRVGLLAAILGAFTVLHIQLSHFLTVDTFLTTFIALGMYFAIDIVRKGSLRAALLMGLALGCAMATKVSVAPLMTSVVVAWGLYAWRGNEVQAPSAPDAMTTADRLSKAILGTLIAVIAAGLMFVLAEPYAIIDWTNFIRNVNEQSRMVRGIADYPYTRQYLNTPPFLYQIWNTAVFGMGVPLGLAAYAGFIFVTLRTITRRRSDEIVLMSWVLVYFFINGIFQVKFLRYMLPLFPFLAIMAAELLWQLWDRAARPWRFNLRTLFSVPLAHAQERDDRYLEVDEESEAWEREKASQAAIPARQARRAAQPLRRKGRQVTAAPPSGAEDSESAGDEPVESPMPSAAGAEEAEEAEEGYEPSSLAAGERQPEPEEPPLVIEMEPSPPPAAEPPPAEALTDASPPPALVPAESEQALPAAAPAVAPSWVAVPPATPPLSLAVLRGYVASWTRGQKVVLGLMAFVVLSTMIYALAFMNIYRQTHPWVAISEWIYRNVPAGSTMAIEHWDDALPLAMTIDGKHHVYEEYKHVEMKNYEDDNQGKLDMLIAGIQKSDYIVLVTNRLYTTISRLPDRYPVTSRYYQLLFAEQLGFKLVADAQSYPSFAGVTFMNDTLAEGDLATPGLLQQARPGGLVLNLGKADESFTVYDHPMPLIFQKVEPKPENELRAMFAGTVQKALDYQQKRLSASAPRQRSQSFSKTFLQTNQERTANEANGTYVDLFSPDGLVNKIPVPVWWLCVEIIGLLALPIGFVVFGNLRDRGYAIAKTLGLLLVSYLPWLGASSHVVPFGRASILLSMLLVGLISVALFSRRRGEMTAWLRANRWLVLTNEIVFTAAFLLFVYIRMLNPDLWQPWNGGEKPMELAYLQAIARSTYFPPYDPLFAGGYINYYYYGQYIGAMLIRLAGIVPSVGFNLIIALLFALTVANAFSITYNLAAALRKHTAAPDASETGDGFLAAHGSLLAWALVGAMLVTLIGNLSTIGEVLRGPWNRGQTTINSTIPGIEAAARLIDGVRKGLQPGQRMFDTFNYWNPSRVIPETINEFPFWSYLFADLHPHMIGIPFTLMVLAMALSLLKERRRRPQPALDSAAVDTPDRDMAQEAQDSSILAWIQDRLSGITPDDVLTTLALGLALGALGVINTWDLPTYLGVLLIVILLRGWLENGQVDVAEVLVRFGLISLLSVALYMPFYQKYQALAAGIGVVRSRTPVGYYLAIYGFFLFAIITYIVVDARLQRRAWLTRLLTIFGRRYDDAPFLAERMLHLVHPRDTLKMSAYGLMLLMLFLAVLALTGQWILVLLIPLLIASLVLGLRGERTPEHVFTWVLIFTGLLVSIGIEVFFLRDWLQGGSSYRMNTVFKFGIQIWIFLALGAAAGLSVVVHRFSLALPKLVSLRSLWYICLLILVFISALFPILGIPARATDRFPGARPAVGTLDGSAFMTVGKYTFDWERKTYSVDLSFDYDAIQWLLHNVQGSPVIAEAAMPYYREFGSRVSAFTGLPSLLGPQHEQEQRPGDTQVGPRENEVRTLYNEPSFDKVIPILQQNRVRYIYVGQLETGIYAAAGLAKFDQATGSYLTLAYENAKTKIYEVRDLP